MRGQLSINGGKTASESQLNVELFITFGVGLLAIFGHELFNKYTITTHVSTTNAAAPGTRPSERTPRVRALPLLTL